jgi:hypothetical protein
MGVSTFAIAGILFLLGAVLLDDTVWRVLSGIAGLLLFLGAAVTPSNVKQVRALLVNGSAAIGRVVKVDMLTTGKAPSGRLVAYEFDVEGTTHRGEHSIWINDARFPHYPEPGDVVFVVYDANEPSGDSVLWGRPAT